tara:strand:+ start:2544 stop:2711 length:168 start_codon:yes stop_codon:yes gene_type:complete
MERKKYLNFIFSTPENVFQFISATAALGGLASLGQTCVSNAPIPVTEFGIKIFNN